MRYLVNIAVSLSMLIILSCGSRKGNFTSWEKDSINHVNDSLELIQRSDSLYKIEGNIIVKDFHFGMTKSEFNTAFQKTQKKTNGIITLQCYPNSIGSSYDFIVDKRLCKFDKGKLYEFVLRSVNEYEKHSFSHNSALAGKDYFKIHFDNLEQYFTGKYGRQTEENSYIWNLNYKCIQLTILSTYTFYTDRVSEIRGNIGIIITDPKICSSNNR